MSQDRPTEHPIDPLFTRRWSPRAFNGESIPEATLFSFFEAARWAPSSYNSQPWRFIYGRAGTPSWQPIFDSLGEFNRAWAHRASALVLVLSKTGWVQPGKTEAQALVSHSFDAGAAWASLALQATLSGWHAHGIGGFDREGARRALSIPADHAIEAVIAIGRKGDKAVLSEALQAREAPNQRLPLSQLVADGRFAFGV
jgi:nitroreductase